MLKRLKPDHYYIIVNLDEPYAEDVFEVLKYGQQQKERLGESAWPEGDIDFKEWVRQTWRRSSDQDSQGAMLAAMTGRFPNIHDSSWPEREYYSLLSALRARNATLEKVLQTTKQFLDANPDLNGTGPLRGEVAALEGGEATDA